MAPGYAQRFQPVIFSDAGSNLYPLCDLPNDTLPKALLPVLNRPMIAYPLQWLVTAGFRSCLLVAPVAEHSALTAALRSLYLVPPGGAREVEAGSAQAAAVAASASTESNVCVTMGGATCAVPVGVSGLVEPMPAAPVMHVELVPNGPKAGEAVRSLRQPSQMVERTRWGTAQLLYWLAATRQLDQDPLVVPVDLIAPHMPLSNFLTAHLSAVGDSPTVSCLFYERGAGEGTGKERERDGPANLFTAYDRVPLRLHEGIQVWPGGAKDTLSVHEPLLVMDSDDVSDKNSSDLELRMSLLWKHPYLRISTSLLDSHVYALHLAPLLPLLEAHPELNHITEQLVPFIIKCGWQSRLSAKAGWRLDAARSTDGALPTWTSVADMDALSRSARGRPRKFSRRRSSAHRRRTKGSSRAPIPCRRSWSATASCSSSRAPRPCRPGSLRHSPCLRPWGAARCRSRRPRRTRVPSIPVRSCLPTASLAQARRSTSVRRLSTRSLAATA